MWNQLLGTIRNAIDGDAAARARAGGWARVLIDQQQQERLQQMLLWLERVQLRSAYKWYPPGTVGACQVASSVASCRAMATGACSCCGRPVCLRHAMISADADLLCASCFSVARQNAKPFEGPQAKPAEPQESEADALEKAYQVLGVKPTDDDEVVRKAYKEKLRRNHPDGKKSETAKRRAEVRFKEIRAAWDTISAAKGIR